MPDITISGSIAGISLPSDLTVTVGGVSYTPSVTSVGWSVSVPQATLDAFTGPIDITVRAQNQAGVTQISRIITAVDDILTLNVVWTDEELFRVYGNKESTRTVTATVDGTGYGTTDNGGTYELILTQPQDDALSGTVLVSVTDTETTLNKTVYEPTPIHNLVGYNIVGKYLAYQKPVIDHTPDQTFTTPAALEAQLDSQYDHNGAIYSLTGLHSLSSEIKPNVKNCIITTDPNSPATLDGGSDHDGGSGSNFGFLLDNCTNTEVSNFNITGMQYHGIAVGRENNENGGLNNRILCNTITECGTTGIAVRNQALGTLIEANTISLIGSGDTRGEGVYIGYGVASDSTNHVFDTTVRGNEIFDTNAEGIDVKRNSRGVVIEFNHIHDVDVKSQGAITCLIDKGDSYTANYNADVIIRSNVIQDTTTRDFNGNGIVIGLGTALIEDNIIFGNAASGISVYSDFEGPNDDCTIRNNIVWENGGDDIEENQTNGNGSSTANADITRTSNYVETGALVTETAIPQFAGPFPATTVNAFAPGAVGAPADPPVNTLTATLGSQDITDTTARIRWTPSEPASGQVVFGLAPDNLNRESVLEPGYLSLHAQTIPNNPPTPLLDAATTYYFEVRGENAAGDSYKQAGSFTTTGVTTDATAVNQARGTTTSTAISYNVSQNDTESATGTTTYALEGTATNVVVDTFTAATGAYSATIQGNGSWSFKYNMLLDGQVIDSAFESGVYSSTPVTGLYVDDATGNDSNAGTLGAPFLTIQKGIDTATTGDTVYVKAGDYGDQAFNLNKDITVEGYKTTAGDRPTLALFNDADFTIDSAEIPVIDKGYRNNDNTGITVSATGASIVSLAVRQYKECVYLTGDNTNATNIYAADSSRLDSGDYSGKGIHTRPGADGCTLENVRCRNVSAEALGVYGNNGTWNNVSAYCNTQANGIRDVTQYYLIWVGNNNNMSNLLLKREYGITEHPGHLAFKSDPQYNTLDGFRCINLDNAVQFRHQEARFNTVRNGVIDDGLGICCRDGGRDNIAEYITFNNVRYPIWFHDGTEDEPNNTGYSGSNNTFRYLTINNANNAVILTNGTNAGIRNISGNIFDNIVVNGANNFVEIDGGALLSNNIFTNTTLNNVSNKVSGSSSRPQGYQLDSGSTAGITVTPSNFSLP